MDPDGQDVAMLDEKAKQRVLSTLSSAIRSQVEKQIGKDGVLKKGALDKIKSAEGNFQDLKSLVNGEGVVEVMTSAKDAKGNEFEYNTPKEQEMAYREEVKGMNLSEEEIKEDTKDLKPTMKDGTTLSAEESPSKNIRVIIADGTGKTADEPAARFAQTTAHELYGHALRAQRGQSWRHDDGGPVDVYIFKVIEPRTAKLYQPPPKAASTQRRNRPK